MTIRITQQSEIRVLGDAVAQLAARVLLMMGGDDYLPFYVGVHGFNRVPPRGPACDSVQLRIAGISACKVGALPTLCSDLSELC